MDRIRAERQVQRISGTLLAKLVTRDGYPVSRPMLSSYENGSARSVPVDFVVSAARVLGVPVASLLTDPDACPVCHGQAPTGFTCNACGNGGVL